MAAPANAVDRLIDKVANNLGRPGDTDVDDYAIVWINEAQREVCNRANFWFMHESATISFAQSDTSAALPSDFKDEDAVWLVDTSSEGYTELFPMTVEDERRGHDDVTEGEPSEYRLSGTNTLILRPVPNEVYDVQLDYWKYPADLVAAGSSNELLDKYPGILEAGAMVRGLRRYGELEDSMLWSQMFEKDIQNLKVENAERVLPDEFVLNTRPDGLGLSNRRVKGRLR